VDNISKFDSFELLDYPDEGSFFKFMPCLKLQKQRNNFVYNQDLVIISSSTITWANRNPSLYANYDPAAENSKK